MISSEQHINTYSMLECAKEPSQHALFTFYNNEH